MATTAIALPGPSERHVSPWLLAATVPLAAFMEFLDTTIVNVAVEHIAGDLSSSVDEATYVLTSYLVANVIVLPLSGYLTGLLGRKNYYLWSVVIFTIASALCGLAPSLGFLVFFRVLQGLGGGGLQPLSQAILMDAFPPEKKSTAQSLFAVVATVAPAIGPIAGGWLTDNYSWRWIFFINIPIGIFAFVANSRLIQDPPHIERFAPRSRKFDYQGLTFLAVGLGSLQFVIDRGQVLDWFGSITITTFSILSVVSLIAFVGWELTHSHPVVDLRLLANKNFSLSVFAMLVFGFVFYAVTYLQPLFCQQMLGWTATSAGLALSPGALVFFVFMPAMPLLIKRMTPRYMIVLGFLMHGVVCLILVHSNLHVPFGRVLGTRIFEIVSVVFLMIPINVMAYGFLVKTKITSGSGLLNLGRNMGASFGVSMAAAMLARRVQTHQSMMVSHLTPADLANRAVMSSNTQLLVQHGWSYVDAKVGAIALVARVVEQQAMMLSYIDIFWVLAVASFLAAPIPLLIRSKKSTGPVELHVE